MQASPTASLTLTQIFSGLLASFLAGGTIVKLLNTWLNRHKPAAEVHVTEATATEITVRAGSSASEAIIRMMGKLSEAQETIDRLRQERDAWEDEYDKVFVERDDLLRKNGLLEVENKSLERQLKRTNGFVKALGHSLSELDTPGEP
jgi:predicted nuclease with TOPRIM domain